VQTVLPVAVPFLTFLLLTAVGCDLVASDFRALLHRPRVLFGGIVLPVLILPALAVACIALFDPPQSVAAGLLLVAACPIGGVSNFYSLAAGASVALSVTLTGVSCALAAFTIPLVGAVLDHALGESTGVRVPFALLVIQSVALLLAPIALGMTLRARAPRVVERHRAGCRIFAFAALAALLTLIAVGDRARFLADLSSTVPLSAVFVLASFASGWAAGLALRAEPRDRFTLAAEFATRNVAVAASIAITLLGQAEFATFGTTYVLVEAPILLGSAYLFRTRPALLGARVAAAS
jgi:BASS family bile acid:Na+ symporter